MGRERELKRRKSEKLGEVLNEKEYLVKERKMQLMIKTIQVITHEWNDTYAGH